MKKLVYLLALMLTFTFSNVNAQVTETEVKTLEIGDNFFKNVHFSDENPIVHKPSCWSIGMPRKLTCVRMPYPGDSKTVASTYNQSDLLDEASLESTTYSNKELEILLSPTSLVKTSTKANKTVCSKGVNEVWTDSGLVFWSRMILDLNGNYTMKTSIISVVKAIQICEQYNK